MLLQSCGLAHHNLSFPDLGTEVALARFWALPAHTSLDASMHLHQHHCVGSGVRHLLAPASPDSPRSDRAAIRPVVCMRARRLQSTRTELYCGAECSGTLLILHAVVWRTMARTSWPRPAQDPIGAMEACAVHSGKCQHRPQSMISLTSQPAASLRRQQAWLEAGQSSPEGRSERSSRPSGSAS